MPCNKAHKQESCEPAGSTAVTSAASSAPKKHHHKNKNKNRAAKSRDQFNEEQQEEAQLLLSQHQLQALNSHEEVQRKFGDNRLKAIVKRIDNAPDRAEALEKEMAQPEFLEFCDDILEAVGVKPIGDKQLSLEEWFAEHFNQGDIN